MAERRIEQLFECSVETFWERVFFNAEYNTALFRERLRFERWELVEKHDNPDGFSRIIEAIPRVGELPGPIKALMKNGAGYRETGQYQRSKSRYLSHIVSHSLPKQLEVSSDMTVTTNGDHKCRRAYTVNVNAKIFGIGGMLEKRLLDDIIRGYEKAEEFTRLWLEQHALLGQ